VLTSTDIRYNGFNFADFGLIRGTLNSNESFQFGLKYDIQMEKLPSNDTAIFYGVDKSQLGFSLSLWKDSAWSIQDRRTISKILFINRFADLEFVNEEFDLVCSCMPQSISSEFYGNGMYGISIDFISNKPYFTTRMRTYLYQFTTTTNTIKILNESDLNEYHKDIEIEFKLLSTSTSFSITNTNDNNRIFSFSGLSTGETIYIDNKKKRIISSTGNNRLPKFNENWFRMVNGINNLTISGRCEIEIRTQYPVLI
jgi:phage-related protein